MNARQLHRLRRDMIHAKRIVERTPINHRAEETNRVECATDLDKSISHERANHVEQPTHLERARHQEKPIEPQRAIAPKKTRRKERAKPLDDIRHIRAAERQQTAANVAAARAATRARIEAATRRYALTEED